VISTMTDYPLTVSGLLRHAASVHATAHTTTTEPDRTRTLTFAQLIARAAQLAGALQSMGVATGDRVATFLWNCQEHLEAYAGVPAMGAVLHTLNVRMTPAQIAYIINHADDEVVIVDPELAAQFVQLVPMLHSMPRILVTGDPDSAAVAEACALFGVEAQSYESVLASMPMIYDWPDIDERSAAAMCYTSGTTGDPKGVVYSHRSTILHAMSVCSGNAVAMSGQDRILVLVPMFHANAWGWPYAALMSGADVVLTGRHLGPAHVTATIAAQRITLTGGVPTLWNDILNSNAAGAAADLSSVRMILCGGSAVSRALIDSYRTTFNVPVVQAWGMTEVSPLGAVAKPPGSGDVSGNSEYALTQGRLLFGIEARLVGESGAIQQWNGDDQGELQLRGPWVTGSYYRGDSPDSFTDGWLRTGDVGSLDALGYLRLSDRTKDVVKSGGEWISSVTLENTLAEHPDVFECAVIAVPDPRWDERPLAAVNLREGSTASPAELHSWLMGRVAKWWVPERWSIVKSVPRTSVGKYDKKLLRQQYADGELDVVVISAPAKVSS
jgi:fatty-acyl-CoA synthase